MEQDLSEFRPSRLWKRMPVERRIDAAELFWDDEQSADQQIEAVAAIAAHMKFRTKSVLALPPSKRARYLATLPNMSDTIAARALVNYHLARQRPMMAAFLDRVGIAHEEGLITEEKVAKPETEKLQAAAADWSTEVPGRRTWRSTSRPWSRRTPTPGASSTETAADDSGLSERAHFGGGPAAALDRAVHVALPVRARVFAGEQNPAGRTREPRAAARDRMTGRRPRSRP